MAATPTGRALTDGHRAAQVAIRTRLAADVAAAWRLLDLADLDASTPAWLVVMLAILGVHRGDSADAAALYYAEHRDAELAGLADLPEAPELDPASHKEPDRRAASVSLLVTGPSAVKAATARGAEPAEASRLGLARVTAAATRHTLGGGRTVLRDAVAADRAALGWIRVTDADPCAFCAMLASRGPVYKTRQSAMWADGNAGQRFHDGCACTAEPVYDRAAPWPGRGAEFARLWRTATRGLSGTAARRAFRHAIDEQRNTAHTPDRASFPDPAVPAPAAGRAELELEVVGGAGRNLAELSDRELAEAFAIESGRDDPDPVVLDRIADEMDRRDATAAGRDPPRGVDLTSVPTAELFHLWRQDESSPSAVDRIAGELDRRDTERAERLDEPDPDLAPDLDPQAAATIAELDADLAAAAARADAEAEDRARQAAVEARIDVLIARGWDYAEAYAEVHNLDPEALRRQELASALDAHRHAGETREQAARRLYTEWVHVQWIAAEKATNGFLLSRDGVRAGIDVRGLWGGTAARARRYASEELKRWWTEHPRKTFTQFRAELLGRTRDRQAAARSVGQGNDRDFGL